MKTSFTNTFAYLLLAVALFSSCESEDLTPEVRLEGTWEMTNFVAADSVSMQEIDFFLEVEKLFPCVSGNRITFKDGIYLTSFPADCVNEAGQSLQFFPVATSGAYTITEDGRFSLDDGGETTYEGTYRFDGGEKFIFVAEVGNGGTLTVTYAKK